MDDIDTRTTTELLDPVFASFLARGEVLLVVIVTPPKVPFAVPDGYKPVNVQTGWVPGTIHKDPQQEPGIVASVLRMAIESALTEPPKPLP